MAIDGEKNRYNWNYLGKGKDVYDVDYVWDVYETEDESVRVIFNYDQEQIWLFGNYNSRKERYETLFLADDLECN